MLFFSLLPVHIFFIRLPTVNVLCPFSCPCFKSWSRGLLSTDNVQHPIRLQLGKRFMESQDCCCSVSRNDGWLLKTPFSEVHVYTFSRLRSGKLIRDTFLKAWAAVRIALLSGLSGPPKWAAMLL